MTNLIQKVEAQAWIVRIIPANYEHVRMKLSEFSLEIITE